LTAVFRRALGADFDTLHPKLQERFGVSSADNEYCVGVGVMDEMTRGPLWTLPFLKVGTWRHILFPDSGRDVPFTIENYPYVDSFGRETLTFVRTFQMSQRRRTRFDATMVYSDTRDCVVDYLGTHQHLAADLDAQVEPDGSLVVRTGAQRFYEHKLAFRFPMLFSGKGTVREGYDDERQRFTVDVRIDNDTFGELFHYRGWFVNHRLPLPPTGVPGTVKPHREERRE
jgi:hypothetical protein